MLLVLSGDFVYITDRTIIASIWALSLSTQTRLPSYQSSREMLNSRRVSSMERKTSVLKRFQELVGEELL